MECRPIRTRKLLPPKDDLLTVLRESLPSLREGDILAISSKVVSIGEGRCVPVGSIDKKSLIKREAELYFAPKFTSRWGYAFTIANGALVGSAGIDESNGNGCYTLWPKNPMRSAARIRRELQKLFGIKKLGVVITDSTSRPLRRGAGGFALAWSGVEALHDYRGTQDIFGRTIKVEQANMVDALAAAAVLLMGEGDEQTPLVLLRDVPERIFKARHTNRGWSKPIVALKDDLYWPFLKNAAWKRGKNGK